MEKGPAIDASEPTGAAASEMFQLKEQKMMATATSMYVGAARVITLLKETRLATWASPYATAAIARPAHVSSRNSIIEYAKSSAIFTRGSARWTTVVP